MSKKYKHLNPKNADLVTVDWVDITFCDEWNNEDGDSDPVECVTAGWFMEETASEIVVCSTYNYRDEEWATKHELPKTPPHLAVIRKGKK